MLRAPPNLAKAWRLCGRNGEEPVDGERGKAVGVRGLKGVVCVRVRGKTLPPERLGAEKTTW
jgi:hypothetical protein